MALSQQKFREIVFQLLYSQEIIPSDETLMLELIMSELAVSKKNVRLAQERVEKIKRLLPEIDLLISSVSTSYDFNRIQIVTKNILRLAVFELLYDEQIPHKVAIAEAIRLSRKFNTPESASFVNALLDHLYKKKEGLEVDAAPLSEKANTLLQSENLASEITQESLRKEHKSEE
ncbi:MAG: transcription antitermination factor NusB [Parachlamydiaceae bacterium]